LVPNPPPQPALPHMCLRHELVRWMCGEHGHTKYNFA
jgi:hypothetical protein